MSSIKTNMEQLLYEMNYHLENEIIPFWINRVMDSEYGGYLSCYDVNGKPTGDTDKHIVGQNRLMWGFSTLYRAYPHRKEFLNIAKHGFDFIIKHFWDKELDGWYTVVKRDGTPKDQMKFTYGHSFAIYGLCEYYMASGDAIALEYAEKTFDVLQKYAADTYRGGYFERMNRDWTLKETILEGVNQKGLDAHMHLMEAFTSLVEASGKEIHRRKLLEIINLILDKMIHKSSGCGMSVFDAKFNLVPVVDIKNPDRGAECTTNYGHNVELAWLLNRAARILGLPSDYFDEVNRRLVDHSLKYGYDWNLGGIYHCGLFETPAHSRQRVWWENAEVLVGYLDAYEQFKDEKYFEAFFKTWEFDKKYFINHEIGEWYAFLDETGKVIKGDLTWEWKIIYHTARSMLECRQRLKNLIKNI